MSISGVGLDDEALAAFNSFKSGGKGDATNFIIYKISDDQTTIVVDQKGHAKTYDDFVNELPENDCRYAVYDFEFELPNGEGKRNKIVFFTWTPDTVKIRPKMIYASSRDSLRRALNGVAVDVQGADFSDVAHETILEKVSRGAFR